MVDNYITINRRIFEHPFWCEDRAYSRFEAWVDILQSARFEDTKQLIGNRLVEVLRGQLPVSLRYLASRWKWSTKKVNSFLDCLILDNMILKETPKETGQTVLTICNYDKYNYLKENKKHQKKQEGNTKETPRKHQGNKCNIDNTDNISTNVDLLSCEKVKPLSPDTELSCQSDYEKFNDWMRDNTPNVMKVQNQMTEKEFLKLKSVYDTDKMIDILFRMDNYKDLTKKYVSVYKTFLNWAKREYEK